MTGRGEATSAPPVESRGARWLGGRLVRYGAPLAALILLGLIGLCVPFYAGSTIHASPGDGDPRGSGAWRLSWRLEHARLTLQCRPDMVISVQLREPLWVAPNSEGLRWMPRGEFNRQHDWSATIPLWMPLAVLVAVSVIGWRGHASARRAARAARGVCAACGYPSAGLPSDRPCPECGHGARTVQ